MNKLSNKELRELVENTKGRMGVKLKLTGTGELYEKENLVTVYDMVKRDYRNINLDTLREVRCGKIEYKVED